MLAAETDAPVPSIPPASKTVLSLSVVAVRPETAVVRPLGRVANELPDRLKISALASGAPELSMPPAISACPLGSVAAAWPARAVLRLPDRVHTPGACAASGSASTRITKIDLRAIAAIRPMAVRDPWSVEFIVFHPPVESEINRPELGCQRSQNCTFRANPRYDKQLELYENREKLTPVEPSDRWNRLTG